MKEGAGNVLDTERKLAVCSACTYVVRWTCFGSELGEEEREAVVA